MELDKHFFSLQVTVSEKLPRGLRSKEDLTLKHSHPSPHPYSPQGLRERWWGPRPGCSSSCSWKLPPCWVRAKYLLSPKPLLPIVKSYLVWDITLSAISLSKGLKTSGWFIDLLIIYTLLVSPKEFEIVPNIKTHRTESFK